FKYALVQVAERRRCGEALANACMVANGTEIANHDGDARRSSTLYPVGPDQDPGQDAVYGTGDLNTCERTGPIYKGGVLQPGATTVTRPSRYASRGWPIRLGRFEPRALRQQPGRQIAPQRHHQLARQGDDEDALQPAALGSGQAGVEPAAERAVRLMPQPQPGELDRHAARPPVAGLGDALLVVRTAAAERARRQPDIARHFPPVGERPVIDLAHQRARDLDVDAPEPLQLLHLAGRVILSRRGGESRGALLLHGRDLPVDELEAGKLAHDLLAQLRRQSWAVGAAQRRQLRPPIAAPRAVAVDTLRRQQSLDAVAVRRALAQQSTALATRPPRVLLRDARHHHHAGVMPIAGVVPDHQPQQALDIQAIALGPTRPPVHLDTPRIHHKTLGPLRHQKAMQPKAVPPCFVARHHANPGPAGPLQRRPLSLDQRPQPQRTAGGQLGTPGTLLPRRMHPRQPAHPAQFYRSENCGNITRDGRGHTLPVIHETSPLSMDCEAGSLDHPGRHSPHGIYSIFAPPREHTQRPVMKPHRYSATAYLIARAMAFISRDPELGHLVPMQAAEISRWIVEACSRHGRLLLAAMDWPWFRRVVHLVEQATIAGLFLHYALRKLAIEEVVRAS